MTRTTQPTTKNTRLIKANHTEQERALFLAIQQAVRDASIKISDRTPIIKDVNIQTSATPGPYSTDVVSFTLHKQDDDEYDTYLTVSVKLTQPTRPNPDFNEDEPEEWNY